MVNIFGFKLFEGNSSSMEEQMRHKHGTHNRRHRHGPNCKCPICAKKMYRNRKYRGGYTYKQSKEVSEEDVTKSLNSLSKTRSQSLEQIQSRQNTKIRTHGKMKTKKHRKHN